MVVQTGSKATVGYRIPLLYSSFLARERLGSAHQRFE